jgi:predicted RNase H-like nuclease
VVVALVGLDGCKGGWISAWSNGNLAHLDIRIFETFADLANAAPTGAHVAIDIPMGLPDVTLGGGRACEIASRRRLGPKRSSSVFSTPSRRALFADSYESACAIIREDLPRRKGLSKQSWMIAPKIRQVDLCVRNGLNFTLREAHPEVTFASLAGGAGLREGKKTTAGKERRIELLHMHGVDVRSALERKPPKCAADDLIDALACLWTARRILSGEAEFLGEADSYFGQLTGIWV